MLLSAPASAQATHSPVFVPQPAAGLSSPQDTQACEPHIQGSYAIQAPGGQNQPRPGVDAPGWVKIERLPDTWMKRWPSYSGTVWYRVDWDVACTPSPLAFALSYINMAGAVYANDELLWRDISLSEPLSHSWNMPRYWGIPMSSIDLEGRNSVWVMVQGLIEFQPGMGLMRLQPAEEVQAFIQEQTWYKRDLFKLNLAVGAAVGCLFLFIWILQPRRSPR